MQNEYSMTEEFFELMSGKDNSMFIALDEVMRLDVSERFHRTKDFELPTRREYISDAEFKKFINKLKRG